MTQPDGANPSGALNPSHPGAFADWRGLTEADIADRTKAPLVGPTGSYTQVQQDIGAADGNVLPTGSPLWVTFTGDADSTFPRINVRREASSASAAGSHSCADAAHSHGSHTHTISHAVPDYQPAGNGANLMELGFFACSKDRTYRRVSLITGDSWTVLGVTAMYAALYRMTASGDLTLVSQTGNITSTIADTNTEYTIALNTAVEAYKSEIYAIGTLQVTSSAQTCNSLVRSTFWPLSAPSGMKVRALYGYADGGSAPPSSIAYSGITWNSGFVPYYAAS